MECLHCFISLYTGVSHSMEFRAVFVQPQYQKMACLQPNDWNIGDLPPIQIIGGVLALPISMCVIIGLITLQLA